MKRKWTWLLAAVLLAGLLAGASVLYDRLRRNQPTPEQLARETTGAIDEQMLKTYNVGGILIRLSKNHVIARQCAHCRGNPPNFQTF